MAVLAFFKAPTGRMAFPAALDVRGQWEDNTQWSGTSRQVRTRTPYEP
jgi:hypothetical protein